MKRIIRLGTFILIPFLLLVSLLLPATVIAAPDAISLIGGGWDHTEITVKVNYNNSIPQDVINGVFEAIDDWNEAINSLGQSLSDFDLVVVDKGKADITITLRRGTAGVTGVIGQTITNVSRNGSIQNARMVISLAAFGGGFSPTFVGNVVRHELGHALGLGHSDALGDLMYPYLGSSDKVNISSLDINAFAYVHEWYPGNFYPPALAEYSE